MVGASTAGLEQKYHPTGEELKNLENALQGTTGIIAFDTWVEELVNTGYLHNHARMWFASIWCFTLKLPWYRGAQFFYENLLDGDPAANTLSWRWVVGLHTKGKTYQARQSNIETYTEGRFSPEDLSGTSWVPDDSAENNVCYEILPLPTQPESGDHLIVWPDDWSIDVYFKDFKPQSVAMIHPHWESPKRQQHVKDYREAAFYATLRRFQNLGWNCSIIQNGNDLQSYLTVNEAQQISWMKPFVGEGRDLLDQLQPLFDGHRTRELRRAWDDFFFPKAKKGFFTLKKSIPKAVANLDRYF
ncbi:FAD-binding domain-containing protein [Pseudobacteriovorax antillogorgiicola]|uniref:FAD binding domain of DNA photolyase n=1 Tax=Pseudobacteriovorax antillogorgiicola TaxID=1513793 RepID=A0A1Y6CMF2_9BACT|nr:FAD-binding domain-containing protein [Pseudobacteriovorax antillogorgiicola]TCS44775.1 DNA photolyase-like FAD binding protein [Pseudobacteriovorax antillogorgiicola]SMF77548.1 FAD binding domain of DNA photolyase [Pseudobacteriovorax antillogorgiicola]